MSDVGYVYRAFAEDGALLYVGATVRPSTRFSAHERAVEWWARVDTLKIERFASKEEALAAEARAIVAELPEFNRYVPAHPLTAAQARQRAEKRRAQDLERDAALAAIAPSPDPAADLVVLRLNLGHTVRAASFAIGISRGALKAAEDGNPVRPASAKKIADFYGIAVTDILQYQRRVVA